MEPEFITYQKFNDPALAEVLAEQLEQHGIAYEVEEESINFDPGFVFNETLNTEWAVKIKSEDFETVNQLLKDAEAVDVNGVGKDYYLYAFNDDELMDVITRADEWNAFDVVLARKLLAEHGKNISDEQITAIETKRIEELKAPDPPQTFWIVIGYICACLGGLLGIFIGWYLITFKKTLPNGEQVYGYTERDRRHGKLILYIGIAVLTLAILYKLAGIFTDN
jgi:hypothetical protein